jgi:lambda repressor-like predicted transcriptional regulator
MTLETMHREDVVAAIRKRHGSVAEFERAKALPTKSVNEVLRGRPNARVKTAIEELLATPDSQPELSGNSGESARAHRLSSEAV